MRSAEEHAEYLRAFDVARDAMESGNRPRAVEIMRHHVSPEAAERIVDRLQNHPPQWAGGAAAATDAPVGWGGEVNEPDQPTPAELAELAAMGLNTYRARGTWRQRLEQGRDTRARLARDAERARAESVLVDLLARSGHGYFNEYVDLRRAIARTDIALDAMRDEFRDYVDGTESRIVERYRMLAEKNARRRDRVNQILARAPAIVRRRLAIAY